MTSDNQTLADLEAWAGAREWFYRYRLPSGAYTDGPSPDVWRLHEVRRDMMLEVLDGRFGARLRDIECIDLASHEGFFSFELARRTRSVRGVDVRADSVDAARRMAILQDLSNVAFTVADVRSLDDRRFAPADFVLLYGLLYHTEDPIRVLRTAASLTRDTLLIETQTTDLELRGHVEWGHYQWRRPIEGVFYVVEDDEHREGGTSGVALIPSVSALTFVLSRLGFASVRTVPPPADSPEQLARGKRVVVVAHR